MAFQVSVNVEKVANETALVKIMENRSARLHPERSSDLKFYFEMYENGARLSDMDFVLEVTPDGCWYAETQGPEHWLRIGCSGHMSEYPQAIELDAPELPHHLVFNVEPRVMH